MMKYTEIVGVNSIFKNSINLELDYNDESKISQYIPTPEACLILNYYLHSFLKDDLSDQYLRSTTLVGPYGKGKSFLLLVLMFIVSHDSTNKTWTDLLCKIKNINSETSRLIQELDRKKIRLLPVVLSSDYSDLKQSFMLSLKNYLEANDLDYILPETSFDSAIEIIRKWKKDKETSNKLNKLLAKKNLTIGGLIKELTENERNAFTQFVELYNSLVVGQPFNALAGDDIKRVFLSIAKELPRHNYAGLFMVFDEFSKFLESDNESLGSELKLLQDIFEVCNNSSQECQLNLSCIIHKPLTFYSSDAKISVRNNFKTIEGRIHEIIFARSLGENYSLIDKAILKYKGFEKYWKSTYAANLNLYSRIEKSGLKTELDIDILIKGCFPMNPYSVYALIQLSEKVAQNERTLFTFLSDSSPYSFSSFISKKGEGLLNLNIIYDYFAPIIRTDGTELGQIWLNAESYLAEVKDKKTSNIIKALAVILMIDNENVLPPLATVIGDSLQLEESEVSDIIAGKKNTDIFRVSVFNNFISFNSYNSTMIHEKVQEFLSGRNSAFRIEDVFLDLSDEKYIIPRQYNTINKMTRFYRVVYISGKVLCDLTDYSSFYNGKNFADGVVFKIIPDDFLVANRDKVISKCEQTNNCAAFVIPSTEPISSTQISLFKEYYALGNIVQSNKQDKKLVNDINIIREYLALDLKRLVSKIFTNVVLFPSGHASLSELISEQLSKTYSSPIINNELLNKENLSAPYSKARDIVINHILGNGELSESPSSPDNTVYNAVFKNKDNVTCGDDIINCVNVIGEIIKLNSPSKSRAIGEITNVLRSAPYGLRKGVIPILVASAIANLPDNHFILYYKSKEIELNSQNLCKALNEEDTYKFRVAEGLFAKNQYIVLLLSLFNINSSSIFKDDIINLVNTIKNYCLRLPGIVRMQSKENNILGLSDGAIALKSRFMKAELNPYELIFEFLPFLSGGKDDYACIVKYVSDVKYELDNALSRFSAVVAKKLKTIMESAAGSLNSAIHHSIDVYNIVEDDSKFGQIFFDPNLGYDDFNILNRISFAAFGDYIADWNYDRSDDMCKKVSDYIHSSSVVQNILKIENDINLEHNLADIPLASTFKNIIVDGIESFGDSLTDKEKAIVLMKVARELLS